MGQDETSGDVKLPLRTFLSDVRRSLRCWSADPRLPLVGLAFAVLESIGFLVEGATGSPLVTLIAFPITIFFLGFYGALRVWYVQIDRGVKPSAGSVMALTRQLRGRFVRLGILVGIVICIPLGVLFAVIGVTGSALWVVIPVVAIADVVLTFATVTLAFYDSTAVDAVRHSLIVIRQQWPTCAWYVFVPVLTLHLILVLPHDGVAAAALYFVVSLAFAMVALLLKGATVLFYSDRFPTLDDPHPTQAHTR